MQEIDALPKIKRKTNAFQHPWQCTDINLVSSDPDSSILVWCFPKEMDQATMSVSSPCNGG
jgi:hypothetical protein